MGDDLPDTQTPPIQQPWGRLVPCLNSLDPIDISRQSLKIGRAQNCDVVINETLMEPNGCRSTIISKEHCLLSKGADNLFYITDLSKNGTFVNGNKIGKHQTILLKDNDKIGCFRGALYMFKSLPIENELPLTLTPSDTDSPCALTPRAVIPIWGRLISCLLYLQSFDLMNLAFKVGRSACCDAVIDHMDLPSKTKSIFSQEHFLLVRDPDTSMAYITDLSSKGTYLNGELIGKHCKNILQHDDIIGIGSTKSRMYVYKSMHPSDAQNLPVELRKKYEPSRLLGKGGCGEVKLVFEKRTCKMYAMKKIIKGRSSISQRHQLNHPSKIETEINILKTLSHPFIIHMEDITQTDDEVFIVLEYMRGGDLSNRILSNVPLTESNVKFFFYQIVLAMNYLHSNGIAHRDIKPENVLLSSDDAETLIKVTDFGLSKVNEDMMTTLCGTMGYIAPEIYKSAEYDRRVDVWSLGVLLFYMLSKQLPFRATDRHVLSKMVIKGVYTMDQNVWNGVSFLARDLVRKMLIVDPQERITIDQILNHPWLEKDVPMQYRVQCLVDLTLPSTSQSVAGTSNMEPVIKRVRLDGEDSSSE